MQLKKIRAKDMRQAMLQVREQLGEEAAILSSRSLPSGGVEVIATLAPVVPPSAASSESAAEPSVSKEEFGAMRNELHSIRTLLQQRLNGLAWEQFSSHSPMQAVVWERLSTMGIPGFLTRQLIQQAGTAPTLDQNWRRVLTALVHAMPTNPEDPVQQGGRYLLLGPTGAGKTTTIAKLATRYVLEHGPEDVSLVTTDSFRLAAHEQLRALGRILGVTVRVQDSQHSLQDILQSLSHKKLVLVDTAGLSTAQPEHQQQLAALKAIDALQKWLVLPATSQSQVLRAALKTCSTAGVSACILTHLDEACTLGEALALAIQNHLPVVYETFGQGIPDDIAVAQSTALVRKAVSLGRRQADMPIEREKLMNEYGGQVILPGAQRRVGLA